MMDALIQSGSQTGELGLLVGARDMVLLRQKKGDMIYP